MQLLFYTELGILAYGYFLGELNKGLDDIDFGTKRGLVGFLKLH